MNLGFLIVLIMSAQHLYPDERSERVTKNLLVATCMAVIGSTFQFGFNTGVINAPQAIIQDFYNQTMFYRYVAACRLVK